MLRFAGRAVAALVLVAAVRSAVGKPEVRDEVTDRPEGEDHAAVARTATFVTAFGLLLYLTYLSVWPRFSAAALSVEFLAVSTLLAAPELLAGPLQRLTPARVSQLERIYVWTVAITGIGASALLGLALFALNSSGLGVWAVSVMVWVVTAVVVVRITHRGWRSIHDALLDRIVARFFASGAVWFVAGPLFAAGTAIQFVVARG